MRFFQVLCFIQLIGLGHLHAHTIQTDHHPLSSNFTTPLEDQQLFHHQTTQHLKHTSSNTQVSELFMVEDVDGDEDENEKKQHESIQSFTRGFIFNLPHPHLELQQKNNRHFSENLFFGTESRKYILFQVFRI